MYQIHSLPKKILMKNYYRKKTFLHIPSSMNSNKMARNLHQFLREIASSLIIIFNSHSIAIPNFYPASEISAFPVRFFFLAAFAGAVAARLTLCLSSRHRV
jgi:hypothetical protein